MEKECYKSKDSTELGIHIDFYKKLLKNEVLDVKLPVSNSEMNLLTEFLYGVKVGYCKFVFKNYLNEKEANGWKRDWAEFNRRVGFARLMGDESIYHDGRKETLGRFEYQFDVYHSNHYDSEFNKKLGFSSYHVDDVLRNTLHKKESSGGGIGGYVYGQTDVKKLSTIDHLTECLEHFSDEPRQEYIEYINSMKKENKKYLHRYYKNLLFNESK